MLLITGAAGSLGGALARRLKLAGRDVTRLDLHRSREVDIVADLSSADSLPACAAIIHAAAATDAAWCERNPDRAFASNVTATNNLLEHARRCDAEFVFVSSAAVYGNQPEFPIRETTTPSPIGVYAETKAAAEANCLTFAHSYGIRLFVPRPFNIVDWRRPPPGGVCNKFARAVASGLLPLIHGSGAQVRDFISVDDVAEFIAGAIRDGVPRTTVNVGTGHGTPIHSLAKMMAESFRGGTRDLRADPSETSALSNPGVVYSVADITHMRTVFPISAKPIATLVEEGAELYMSSTRTA